mmetsp:Transcript_21141/g.46444  ORF Transcript_21141/g.46444 Transcript_21141/m.46444 type:complete len:168 (-) Transcript_21141:26-529(-)
MRSQALGVLAVWAVGRRPGDFLEPAAETMEVDDDPIGVPGGDSVADHQGTAIHFPPVPVRMPTPQPGAVSIPFDDGQSFIQLKEQGCPLCEALNVCLEACATARHEPTENAASMLGVHHSRFCLTRCKDAYPGSEIPSGENAFVGAEPPSPEEEAKGWMAQELKALR